MNSLVQLQQFMFTQNNIQKGYQYKEPAPKQEAEPAQVPHKEPKSKPVSVPHKESVSVSVPILMPVSVPILVPNKSSVGLITPHNKDKLFWCFYIILKGYEEYQMCGTNSFSVQNSIKIEVVEKLKTIKDKLKELKLKRTELEDELVNKPFITVKGLTALCLIHNISITYIFGRKFCEINPQPDITKKHIITQNHKKEDSLRLSDDEAEESAFLKQIHDDYWFIENIQKPLNAPSAYSVKELQEICERLQIDTFTTANEKQKPKTKKQLYEEILEQI
jgi:hypothetical protein